jgi:predicted AlkP superfamily pyrophosphatase or phosphodiesterase
VVADRLLGDEGVRAARYSKAEAVRVPTLWRLAQESGLRVATLGWPSTVGAEVDANLPDVSIRSGETWAQALQGSASPAVLARAQQAGADAPEAAGPGPARDAVIVAVACGLVASEAPPQLLMLHLSQTRPPLRSLGPSDPQTRAAFASADQEVARLLSCVQAQGRLASTAFAVVGDHGVIPVHTVVAPNAVLARAGLITPENRGSGIVAWTAISRSNGGSAFVYSRDRDEALLARRALEQEAAATGAFRIVSAQEMLRLGADPDAWFGLEAEPGYVFADPARGPVLRPAVARSGGGYLPDRPEMDSGFVAWGPGLARGVRIPAMQQTDVAPTLAPLLGFALDGAEGRVLVGILRLPRVSALPEP